MDIIALWVKAGNGCGIAYIMEELSHLNRDYAFLVVRRECAVSNLSFVHELGHLFGARHDRDADPTENKPFPFNHGYIQKQKKVRSLMSYNNQCQASGIYCTRVNRWSDPDLKFRGSRFGVPINEDKPTDNSETLRRTSRYVANYN
ncbi:MAG: M12 family metallo-peptidase [Aestuariibacter sp.]